MLPDFFTLLMSKNDNFVLERSKLVLAIDIRVISAQFSFVFAFCKSLIPLL